MAGMKRHLASTTAVLALGWFLLAPTATGAAAPIVEKAPEAKILGVPPISCNPTQMQYIIDGGNVLMCGGKATMVGNGWQNYVWPGAVGSNYYYVSAIKGEDGSEKISFFPTITFPGRYEAWVSYRGSENRTDAAPFYVYTDSNVTYKVVVNQKELSHGAFFSVKLGTFYFKRHPLNQTPRLTGIVTLENEGARTSEAVDALFLKYVGPVPPTGLVASDAVATDSITLTWNAAPGVTAYKIYRSLTTTPPALTATPLATVNPLANPTYVDTPLDPGSTYYYWVRTVGKLNKLSTLSNRDKGSTGVPAP